MSVRGVKRLESSAAAVRHQRAWFAGLKRRVAAGAPLVLADADTPHEIFQALDVPYVVNQWWASLCAAQQRAPRFLALLRDRGYPDDVDQYNAISLGSALEPEPERAPWGGLPPVSLFVTQIWTDAHRTIADAWTRELGVPVFALEKAVDDVVPERWWERIADEWEAVIGAPRLDLMTAELHELVDRLEAMTGRVLDEARFEHVLALANEQHEWSRKARDVLAEAAPAPVDIVDSIPSVMIPQWHRGTEWGRDAARRFYEEVAVAVERGDAAWPDERLRLMWVGRGLWFNLGFYQHFQERYGAVFVWSMYLAIAADGYRRYGGDPFRSLAARFVTFADFLGTPGWTDAWHVKEALAHGVHGVVHLVAPDARSSYFTTRALEEAGIPVLEVDASNVDSRPWDEAALVAAIGRFIEDRVEPARADHYA